MKSHDIVCVGIEMSKACDMVPRNNLLRILANRGVDESNLTIIKLFLRSATLQVPEGKSKRRGFSTNTGVPLGDGLVQKWFTIYLDEAQGEKITSLTHPLQVAKT